MDGRLLEGELFDTGLPFPVAVNPADYSFHKLSDLNGTFEGRMQDDKMSITYHISDARITGKANVGKNFFYFVGKTQVLEG